MYVIGSSQGKIKYLCVNSYLVRKVWEVREVCDVWSVRDILEVLKPLQNKKGQKKLSYPKKEQSFSLEKDCFFGGYLKFFWPFLFWNGFSSPKVKVDEVFQSIYIY